MDYNLLENWLSIQDFGTGVEILKLYEPDSFLVIMLQKIGENDWNKARLLEAIEALAATKQASPKPTIEEKREKVIGIVQQDLKAPSERENAPSKIKTAVARRKALYNEGKAHHAMMKAVATDSERLERVIAIIDARPEIQMLWKLTNFYDNNGREPEVIENVAIDTEGLDNVSLNADWLKHYKYINKYKDNLKLRAKVLDRIAECKAIEIELTKRDAFQYANLKIPNLGKVWA